MTEKTFISADGVKIACAKSGAGPALVLVSGTTADRTRWMPVLPALEQRFTVYSCDRRGRGRSTDAVDYAIEREFEDVVAVVDGIGGPVDVLGHSYGAICALEGAARATNVRRLVLYEPPVPLGKEIYPPAVLERLVALHEAGDREGVLAAFLLEVVRLPPAQLDAMKASPVWQARLRAASTIVRELHAHQAYRFDPDRFRKLEVPTLLLLGGESPAFFREAIEAVDDALPRARVVIMPGQHHVAIDTAPDLFVAEVLAFLAE